MTKQRERCRARVSRKPPGAPGLLVRNRPWRCHTGTMNADKLPPLPSLLHTHTSMEKKEKMYY